MSGASDFRREIMHVVTGTGMDMPVVNDEGEQVVIALLGSDPLPRLFTLLARACGYATVFVKMASGSVRQVPFVHTDCAIDPNSVGDLPIPVDAHSTVEMLVNYVETQPDGVVLRTFNRSSEPRCALARSTDLLTA